jgi:hypothetical protein
MQLLPAVRKQQLHHNIQGMHCIMKVDEMVGTLVFMGELRNIYYFFVRKLDRKKSLRRTQHKYS